MKSTAEHYENCALEEIEASADLDYGMPDEYDLPTVLKGVLLAITGQSLATLAVAAATERLAIAQEKATKEVDINRMVDRFLQWKLPTTFQPDGGIYYDNDPTRQPTGTNLFTATQAKEMLEFILE